MKDLNGKTVYITGGSSGIGLAAAKEVCKQGARLVLIARNLNRLEEATRNLESYKKNKQQQIDVVSLDVSDHKAAEEILRKTTYDFGAPDVLVANAGIGYADYFENISHDDFDRVMKINVYGIRNVIHALLPSMKENGGKVVIVSSLAGFTGMISYTAYSTSKYALIGFAESLRPDLKRYGIDVALFCPPEVETPLLDDEAKTLPPEARAIKNMAGQLSVEKAGKSLLKTITGRQFLVVPGFMGKSNYFMLRYFPGFVVRGVIDTVIKWSKDKH